MSGKSVWLRGGGGEKSGGTQLFSLWAHHNSISPKWRRKGGRVSWTKLPFSIQWPTFCIFINLSFRCFFFFFFFLDKISSGLHIMFMLVWFGFVFFFFFIKFCTVDVGSFCLFLYIYIYIFFNILLAFAYFIKK